MKRADSSAAADSARRRSNGRCDVPRSGSSGRAGSTLLDAGFRRRSSGSGATAHGLSRRHRGIPYTWWRQPAKLARGQGRLEQVGGVQRAARAEPAPISVWISSMNRMASGLPRICLSTPLQALLDAAAVGAGQQRAHVQREHLRGCRISGTSPRDAPGQALGNGGLAHAGLADQQRVVLAAAARPGSRVRLRARARSADRCGRPTPRRSGRSHTGPAATGAIALFFTSGFAALSARRRTPPVAVW